MKKRRNVYYFDYSPEAYSYIMTSKILRQSEKNILRDIVNGKTGHIRIGKCLFFLFIQNWNSIPKKYIF